MDAPSLASLARVRILLLPVGPIPRETFDVWAEDIRSFENIRLGDIPSDNRAERSRFTPNPLSRGHLHLSFPSHPPSASENSLALFRPSSFPLGVIGVAACSQEDSLSTIQAQFNAVVNDLFPSQSVYRSIFPLSKTCFVFEDGDGNTNLNLGEQLSGLVVIPSMMGNKKLYIGTLLADLCSNILAEFSTVVQTLESPLGNEYLNATTFPILPSSSEMPTPINGESIIQLSHPPLSSHNSQPELNSTAANLRKESGLNLKRTSSSGPTPSPSKATFGKSAALTVATTTTKKRQSGIGAASSHGRLFKVLGDLFLLAGRLEDALVWYTEAVALCKAPPDALWLASSLEGMAAVSLIEAWSSGQAVVMSTSGSKEPWADVSEKLNQAAAIYLKSALPVEGENVHTLVSLLYTRNILMHAHLIFATWSSKGWGPLAFAMLLQPGSMPPLPATLSAPEGLSYVGLERLSSITKIARSQIASIIAEAHGPWLLHLAPRERISVLETIAGLYGCLGYRRKEAYVLREVLGCVLDLVVLGRDDFADRRSHATPVGTGLGFQNVNLNNLNGSTGTVSVRANERTDGNDSILRIVKYVCRVHGIDLEAVKLIESNDLLQAVANGDDEDDEPEGVPAEPFGWPELQIGIIREALAVAEALPDYPAVAQFSLSALKVLHPVLTIEDQEHLYATSTRALTISRRRGDRRCVDYWCGQPIVSIEVSPLPFVRMPVESPISSLSAKPTTEGLPTSTFFFLHNKKAQTSQGQMIVVQNENVEVIITLRNPFVLELELQSLTLSTSGVPFKHKPISVIVPPNSYHPVAIAGTATEAGVLTVRGCIVQAPGGAPREFVLRLSTDDEEEKQSRRRSAFINEIGRTKYGGLDSRPWEKKAKRLSRAGGAGAGGKMRFLELKVVPEQPLLRIRRTSLTHDAVMLYNGETATIRLTLENVSSLPVDFVKLSFEDDTIPPAQQALADGELSIFDTYETEYDLIHRPVFSWEARDRTEIAPGEKLTVSLVCSGKAGCTSGSIQVSYSYVHRRKDALEQPPEVFHMRHLSYPVLVTVYHMLECHGMDIISGSGLGMRKGANESDGEDAVMDIAQKLLMDVDDPVGWCIFAIEVRNTYGLPFDVTFERTQKGAPHIASKMLVAPGSTSRILVPLRKFLLSEEHVSRPIPTLSDRQFVVDKSGMTSAEQHAQRELFWYREELFKTVHGRWQEAGGTRSGRLSLRRQRMTLPMLEALRTETARVHLSVLHEEQATEPDFVDSSRGRCVLPPNQFLYLRARITNMSPSPLVLSMDFSLEPADHIIYEGCLSDIPVGKLESGSSVEVDMPVCFVACGRFDITADVRLLGGPGQDSRVGKGALRAHVQEDGQ